VRKHARTTVSNHERQQHTRAQRLPKTLATWECVAIVWLLDDVIQICVHDVNHY
jgi:hypothetical protein